MHWSRSFSFLFCALCMAGVFLPALADIQSTALYETDFSENPGWTTNSPSRYYWDPAREMYHFRTEGGTNGYACIPVSYDGQSFTLDYDVILLESQPNSAFRFGLTSSEMDFTRGTTILSALENGKYGKLFSLRVVDQNNQMREISSYYASYCGALAGCNTVEFKENTTYHVTLRYNRETRYADIKVVNKETNEDVFGYFVPVAKELLYLDRLAITTKGDYTSGPFSEGFIDNVKLVVLSPVTATPTTVPVTPAETPSAPPTTPPVTTTGPTPTPTPQSSPNAAIAVLSLLGAGLAAGMARREKK